MWVIAIPSFCCVQFCIVQK